MANVANLLLLIFALGAADSVYNRRNYFPRNLVRKVNQPTCTPLTLPNGRVKFKSSTGFAQFLCRKGFILAGERYAKCFLGQWEGEVPVCVKNTCKKPKDIPNGFVYPSHRGGVLNYFCKAGHKLQGSAALYCNGKSWSSPLPTCIDYQVEPSLNCDFERADLCGWTHDINHDFDWTRSNFSTPSGHIGTGPAHDHTPHMKGEGFYMYIEATSRNINDTARLISPAYTAQENNTCLEFYYHMYGASAGELRVYCKKVSSNWTMRAEDEVFWRGGDQGNQWRRGLVVLGPIEDEFQIIFEGIRGGSYLSDIAIDDVKIIENCVEDELTTMEIVEETTTMSWATTLDYETEYSCTNRCGVPTQPEDLCECSSGCFMNNSCCPDYIAICILGSFTTEDGTTEEDWTSWSPTTEEQTTTRATTTIAPITTTIPITSTTRTTATTTRVPSTTKRTTIRPTPSTKKTTIATSTRPTTPTTTSKRITSTTTTTRPTKPTTNKPTPTTTTLTTKPTTKKTIPTTKPTIPNTKPTTPTPKPTIPITKPTIPIPKPRIPITKPTIPITKPTTPITKPTIPITKPTIPTTKQRVYPTKPTIPITKPTPTILAIVVKDEGLNAIGITSIVIGVLLAVVMGVGAVVLRKRGFMRYRRSRRSFDDSQSDVRFLTSDEILNFNLDE